MSAAGPPQGARPPRGERREATQGAQPTSAAGPPQGARPPRGERREATQGGQQPSAAGPPQGARPLFIRAWALLAGTHAGVTVAIALASKLGLTGWLRDALGFFSILTIYGPIALAAKLGATRSAFERPAWLFGDITPAGWALVIASWLAAHALLAAAWVKWRRRRSGADAAPPRA